jgi:hypothetical protein
MLRELNDVEMGMVSGGLMPTPGDIGIIGNPDLDHAVRLVAGFSELYGDFSVETPDWDEAVTTDVDSEEIEEVERALEIILRNTPGIGYFDRVEFNNDNGEFRILGPLMV